MTRNRSYQKQPHLMVCILCTAIAFDKARRDPGAARAFRPVGVPANRFVKHMRDVHPVQPKASLLKRVAHFLKQPV